jgi:hypothetical protein
MKKQIKRLSPHQNGKVFGVLMAVTTLPLFLPMILMMNLAGPPVDRFLKTHGPKMGQGKKGTGVWQYHLGQATQPLQFAWAAKGAGSMAALLLGAQHREADE